MDEPTASLTRAEVDRLLSIVSRLKAAGIAVVFVSHRLDEVVKIAERVTVMRDGRKVGTWPVTEVDQRASTQASAPAVEDGLYLVPKVIE